MFASVSRSRKTIAPKPGFHYHKNAKAVALSVKAMETGEA